MIHTALTERYGLEVPFVSAGMSFIALPPLAAAISNAGGFGQLACGVASPAVMHEMIAATRERTSRPFGVNLIIEATMFGPLTTRSTLKSARSNVYPPWCSSGRRRLRNGSGG